MLHLYFRAEFNKILIDLIQLWHSSCAAFEIIQFSNLNLVWHSKFDRVCCATQQWNGSVSNVALLLSQTQFLNLLWKYMFLVFWLYWARLRCFLYVKFGETTELNLTFETTPVLLPCNCQVKNSQIHLSSTLQYPASRGYIFAVWAGMRKVASDDKSVQKSQQMN